MDKRIIYILKHNPWGRGGGATASRLYLNSICRIFPSRVIDVLIANTCIKDVPSDISPNINLIPIEERSKLSKILSPISGIMHRYQAAAKKMLSKYDYEWCIFDHSSIGGTLAKYFACNGIKLIQLHHNYEPKYYKDSTNSLINQFIFVPIVRRNEKKAYNYCTINLFLTELDKNTFERQYGNNGKKNLVTGIYIEDFSKSRIWNFHKKDKKIRIAITGALNSTQNIDAICDFFSHYYSRIPSLDQCSIIIAGNKPSNEIRAICQNKNNVTLIDSPSDIDKAIKDCNLFLCHCRLGSGIKIRILDGFRNGMPILAHRVSANGYEESVKAGYMEVYSNPDEFVNALQKLSKLIYSENIYSSIIEYAKETYSIDRMSQMISESINNIKLSAIEQ